MKDFDLKKYLAEGKLLNENAPGYDNDDDRYEVDGSSVGDGKYEDEESELQKENDKNDYANSEEDFTDSMVIEKIKDIIKYHELDPSDVLEEIGQEFGIAFEFGRG